MANILRKVGQSFNVPVHTYEADTEEDMNTIDLQGVLMGSKCYIINAGKCYMLNSKGEWKIMPSGGGSGTGGEAAGGTVVLQYMPHELVGHYFVDAS